MQPRFCVIVRGFEGGVGQVFDSTKGYTSLFEARRAFWTLIARENPKLADELVGFYSKGKSHLSLTILDGGDDPCLFYQLREEYYGKLEPHKFSSPLQLSLLRAVD